MISVGHRRVASVAVTAVVVMVAAACGGSSSKSSSATTAASGSAATTRGNTASAPGVTPTQITIGVQTSLTGSASPDFTGIDIGIRARFGLQNAEGGVFGRQLKFVTKDDTSTDGGSETAAQALVGENIFGVMAVSASVVGGYRAYVKAGIPVTGGGFDGPEWEQKPDTNMFAVIGQYPDYPQWTTVAQFIKDNGGTNIACLGYNVTSSKAGASGCAKAAKDVGIKAGYVNDSISFGTVAVSPIALAMKSTGVDSAYMVMDASTNLAIVTAARQTGVNLKVPVLETSYGQELLDDPAAFQAAQGAYFQDETQPVELDTPATQQMVRAFKTYAGYSGIPGFDYTQGWLAADLMIKGLQLAGQNPTRSSFITNLRKVTNYDADGLLASADNFAAFGQVPATQCFYFPQLVGDHFVTKSHQPVCGTLISS
jgi:ABC-type branched-subunit amino acid transport system substrate-binding protein